MESITPFSNAFRAAETGLRERPGSAEIHNTTVLDGLRQVSLDLRTGGAQTPVSTLGKIFESYASPANLVEAGHRDKSLATNLNVFGFSPARSGAP